MCYLQGGSLPPLIFATTIQPSTNTPNGTGIMHLPGETIDWAKCVYTAPTFFFLLTENQSVAGGCSDRERGVEGGGEGGGQNFLGAENQSIGVGWGRVRLRERERERGGVRKNEKWPSYFI